MKQFAIVTDSAANITDAVAEEHNIVVVPLRVVYEGKVLTPKQLDEKLEFFHLNGGRLPEVHSPSVEEFEMFYQSLVDQGVTQIISLHMSAALSHTFVHAQEAAANVCERLSTNFASSYDVDRGVAEFVVPFKEAHNTDKSSSHALDIRIVDVRSASIGEGVLCLEAEAAFNNGSSIDEVLARLLAIRQTARVYLIPRELTRLGRSGWINRFTGMLSRLMNKRMILTFNKDGYLDFAFKGDDLRDTCAALARMLADYSREAPLKYFKLQVFGARELKLLEKPLRSNEIDAQCLGIGTSSSVVSLYVGPGTVGVYCYPESLSTEAVNCLLHE